MTLWKVTEGRNGQAEQVALEKDIVAILWNELPDLSTIKTRDELKDLYNKIYPDEKKMSVANMVGQIWAFIRSMKIGDLVAVPLKTQYAVAIGKIAGDYEYRKDLGDIIRHTRKVKWIKKDIPRGDFDQDILYSFGAFMTVCQITRNNAEKRVEKMLEGKKTENKDEEKGKNNEEVLNIEEVSRDSDN